MTIARAHLVDPAVTRWYHCVTRCVRRAFLLGEGMHDRKSWIAGVIRCRFIFSGKNDELTPDFRISPPAAGAARACTQGVPVSWTYRFKTVLVSRKKAGTVSDARGGRLRRWVRLGWGRPGGSGRGSGR